MEKTRSIIAQHRKRYPEFDDHEFLIKKAIANFQEFPDISVECCKSLIEGVCKDIIKHVDPSLEHAVIENFKLKRASTKALDRLFEYGCDVEGDFVEKLVSTIETIGRIRNTRGDVSHGHIRPKLEASTSHFAQTVMDFTDTLTSYLLEIFYSIELEKDPAYEDNSDFNSFLDELNPMEDKLSFSLALYHQYKEDYMIQLEEYLYDNKEETE